MILVGGKIKKMSESYFFYWKSTNSIYIYAVFEKENPLFFVHVGGKNKKKNEMSDFFLVGHDFTTSEDLVNQTI